jgi:hypothetical protein
MAIWAEAQRFRYDIGRLRDEGPRATREEVRAVGCPTCGVSAGEECDAAVNKFFFLGVVFSGLGRIHVKRYLQASGDTR